MNKCSRRLLLACLGFWCFGTVGALELSRNIQLPVPELETAPGLLSTLEELLGPVYNETVLEGLESFTLRVESQGWFWLIQAERSRSTAKKGPGSFGIDQWSAQTGSPLTERWEGSGSGPRVVRFFDALGNRVGEKRFNAQGQVQSLVESQWDDARIQSEVVRDSAGLILSSRRWTYNDMGLLLDVELTEAGSVTFTHYVWENGLVREIHHNEGAEYRIELLGPRGQRDRIETFSGDTMQALTLYNYAQNSPASLDEELILDARTSTARWTRFSNAGRSLEQVYYVLGKVDLPRWLNADTATRNQLRRALPISESWRWDYDDGGRQILEEYWSKGKRRRIETIFVTEGQDIAIYLDGKIQSKKQVRGLEIIDTSYKDGTAIFRTYSRDNQRYREEELANGEIVRTREFE